MMYHPIKFGCKKISSSADMVDTVIFDQMTLAVTLNLKTANQSSSMTLWPLVICCITIPSLVTDDSAAEEISSTWTFTGILNHFCDLDHGHNRAIQSFHKTVLLMMMYHQTKFSCKKISSSDNKFRSYILIITPLTVTLTLKTEKQFFWQSGS